MSNAKKATPVYFYDTIFLYAKKINKQCLKSEGFYMFLIVVVSNIKVGHLLSEFVIEFVSELWCRILLSKVTTKVSELRCRMWIESGFRQ